MADRDLNVHIFHDFFFFLTKIRRLNTHLEFHSSENWFYTFFLKGYASISYATTTITIFYRS